MRGSFLSILFLSVLISAAQDVKLESGFWEDSLGIGEEIHFWVTASYPQDQEILFPDSHFSFTPFELVHKTYVPSTIENRIIKDTSVYTLQSFEIDAIQYFQLPVYYFTETDSSTIYTEVDSIYFRELVEVASDTVSLKTNLGYQEVNRFFNYPLLWIISGVLAVIAIAIVLIFGKKIRKNLRIRRLRKDYIKFSDRLTAYINRLKNESDPKLAEEVVSFWKRYYERLESLPISKLTTQEILSLENTSELKESLRSIDKCIYGNLSDDSIYRSFQSIEDFTQHRYSTKISELRNGE